MGLAGGELVERAAAAGAIGDDHRQQRLAERLPRPPVPIRRRSRPDRAACRAHPRPRPGDRRRHGLGRTRARGAAPRPAPTSGQCSAAASCLAASGRLHGELGGPRRATRRLRRSATSGSLGQFGLLASPLSRSVSARAVVPRGHGGCRAATTGDACSPRRPLPVRCVASAARRAPRPPRWPPTFGLLPAASMAASVRRRRSAKRSSSAASSSASGPTRRRARRRHRRARRAVGRASASRLATTPASISWPRSRSSRPATLDHHGGQAAGTLAQLLDAHHLVAEVGVAAGGQLGLGRQHRGVERGELGADLVLRPLRASTCRWRARSAAYAGRRSRGRRRTSAARAARRPDRRGGVLPRPGARAGAAGDEPRAAGPALAAGWPRWRRAGVRPSPCGGGTSARRPLLR